MLYFSKPKCWVGRFSAHVRLTRVPKIVLSSWEVIHTNILLTYGIHKQYVQMHKQQRTGQFITRNVYTVKAKSILTSSVCKAM
jgi:hypothetical protein